ncbi:MAG: hypothetical protein FIA82_05215 [Melioribacter sp.]|nr:hypothetical protein [Melioribacter sp.]
MIFMLGLEKLSKEEKVSVLSQVEVLNTMTLINDSLQKNSKKGKEFLLNFSSKLTEKHFPDFSKKIIDLNNTSDWDAEVMKNKIAQKYKQLCDLTEDQLNTLFTEKIKKLANFDIKVSNEILANGIVHRVAKAMKLDTRLYLNNIALENAVFEESIKEQLELIKKNVNSMNPDELNKLEELLDIELKKLDECQKDAIKNALKIEELSAKAMISFIKTLSTATAIQVILGSFGFGFFLFLTTFMKAFGLLLGLSFSFGTYAAVTSAFGFFLSFPFLLITFFVSTGFIVKLTNNKIDDEISKLLILIGRSKLYSNKYD